MSNKKALGKGLGALIGEGKTALVTRRPAGGEGRLRELPLDQIAVNRRQPRRSFPADELEELAASIRALGVVQPVVVRPLQPAAPGYLPVGTASPRGRSPPAPAGAHYELIAGERRLRAARLAGLDYIPALVRPADEVASLEIALAENVAREDLNSIEEAQAYAALVDEFGLTHERVGRAGRPQPRGGHQPAASARAARRRAAHDRAGRAQRRARARAAGAARPRAAPQGRAPRRR